MSAITSAFLLERIEKTKALIVAYEDAILALSTGSVQQYSLDTGQTRQMVTKQNISSMRDTLLILENRLSTLDARRCGASTRVVPAW